jgi:hypothetical protein
VTAYNLGNLRRRLGLPKRIDAWSVASLQQRLMNTGGRLVKHARYYWVLLAEQHLTRRLFGAILRRLDALPGPAGEQTLPLQSQRAEWRPGGGGVREIGWQIHGHPRAGELGGSGRGLLGAAAHGQR